MTLTRWMSRAALVLSSLSGFQRSELGGQVGDFRQLL